VDLSVNATSEHFLEQVDRLIDWAALAPLIQAIDASSRAEVSPAAAKMLLLARWYGMSEAALLEACQDRLSFRKFLGLPLADGPGEARLVDAYRRHGLRAPIEVQCLLDAIEAQLLAKGVAIRPGMGMEAAIVLLSSDAAVSGRGTHETSFFQPGEIAELLKQGESALVRGATRVSTHPPYGADSAVLTSPTERVSPTLQAAVEWPWGVTTELSGRLNIGRDHQFCPFASELQPYLHVSRKHAELTPCPEGVWVRDLRSRNGTFINDDKVPNGQAYLIDTEVRVRFGPYCVVQLKIKFR
jgi:hypothetical protein